MSGPRQPSSPQQDAVVAAAAAEQRSAPVTEAEAADLADRYDAMMRLAALFDDSGEEMRQRATLGSDILAVPAFTDSAVISPVTYDQAETDVRDATTGKRGLMSRSIELDADALVLRATVLTYRWIDELQQVAFDTLGSIAGRAIGYLAPQVALGGAIVSAGLIETDALDRDGVAAYLSELANSNPELMEHVTSGGGGLLDGLRMRSLLTVGVLSGDDAPAAGLGGLRTIGVDPFPTSFEPALRDVAGGLVDVEAAPPEDGEIGEADAGQAPVGLTALLAELGAATSSVVVRRVAPGRFLCLLPGPDRGARGLRLVGGDGSSYAQQVVRSIEDAVGMEADAHVMLVGSAHGGVTAAEIASTHPSERFVVDQVVIAGAPSAHVPRLPETTRMLALEDRSDPVALLGSLINARAENRVTVVYDTEPAESSGDDDVYVAGGRAADAATHPTLVAEIARIRSLGYLAG